MDLIRDSKESQIDMLHEFVLRPPVEYYFITLEIIMKEREYLLLSVGHTKWCGSTRPGSW